MGTGSVVIAHYTEIGLKGRNRSYFERILATNIQRSLDGAGGVQTKLIPGRVLIRLPEEIDKEDIASRLNKVFGLSGFSFADELIKPSLDTLAAAAVTLATKHTFDSFQIRARRGHSSFPDTSQTINEFVGQAVKDASGKRVDLSNAEWTCYIELVTDRAYLYSERHSGPGGLPVGSSGRVMALLSGGIDSPVAGWQIAKRGAVVDFVHFHGQPYSDPSSARQASRLARHLEPWLIKSKLWMVPFGEIQAEIVTAAPQQLRIVLYRRFMMRIAEALALREGAGALVTGESLGQVASQTLPNLTATDQVVETMPVLRPLVGHDKLEIEAIAKRIGTYEISIEPHQDCCVLFVPRQVTTAARPSQLAEAEARLDVTTLVEKGVANAST